MKNKMFDKTTNFFRKSTTYQQSKKKIDSVENTFATEEFERCIMCGQSTCIPVSMPINLRENYVIGCGQLCTECAKKQQKTVERENTLITAQILQAVEQCRKESKK